MKPAIEYNRMKIIVHRGIVVFVLTSNINDIAAETD